MRYLPHTEEDISSMLETVGAGSLEELFRSVPEDCLMKNPLELPPAMSEWELNDHMDSLAGDTATAPEYRLFIGAGCYEHYIPSVVSSLLARPEFVTAYTPYQPEVSQGTLQGIYEYQTLVCRLLGMEVANGSMYDGASALAEALLMAARVTGEKRVAVSRAVHPHYRDVARTYLSPSGIEIVEMPFREDGKTDFSVLSRMDGLAAVAIQSPNFFGCIEDIAAASESAHRKGAMSVAVFTEPLAYGLLKNPGRQDADIACGEGRSLGLPRSYGGMALGIFTAKKRYVRNMPGRIVGRTVDGNGERGFVVTLATREQHIRREKATSNICTNQSLCALGAAIYMATLGKTGIREVAKLNYNKSEYLKKALREAGVAVKFESPTFNEFVVEFPDGFETAYERLAERRIIAGLPLENYYPELPGCYLLCATETKTREAIDSFVHEVKSCMT